MSIPVGYWIEVKCKPDSTNANINFIKVIPSDRIYENQPSGEYYEILARTSGRDDEVSIMLPTGSLEECKTYIYKNFIIKDTIVCLDSLISMIHKELEYDCLFLKKSSVKKDREIAIHIANALGLLDILEDWNDRGLGDAEI